jgi:AsmA protein
MGRLLKIILAAIAIIILLIIIAIVALPFFFDPNDFKPEIQAAVKDSTGRELVIEGDLALSVFPWLGVTTGELTLSNAAGFPQAHFAKISASHVKVKVLPLLSKKLEVSRIELKGLDLNLAKNSQGISNWDDLTQAKTHDEQPQQPTDKKEEVSPLAALVLGGISIEQAHIVWDDQQSGAHTEINDFNLTTGQLFFNQPIDIDLSLQVINREPDVTKVIELSTDLTVNDALTIINVANLKLKNVATGKAIPGGTLTSHLQSDIAINLAQNTVSISGLTLNLDDVTEEKLKVSLVSDADINLAEKTITTTGLNLTVNGLMQNKLNAHLLADVAVNLAQQTLSISGLKLDAGGLHLSADITGTQIQDNPVLKGPIHLAPFNLAQFLKSLDIPLPEMKDASALSQLSVAFNLLATKNSADINNLAITLDDSHITGSAQVKNFAQPASKFNIAIDSIDLGRYLAPKTEDDPNIVATPASAAVAAAQLFPIETLRAFKSDGQLSIGTLIVDQLSMKGVSLKLNSNQGIIKTQQSVEQLYQGSYSGQSSINVQQNTPQLTLNETLSNIQIEPLLKAMQIETKMSGLVNAAAKIQGSGNTTAAIKSSLAGNVVFSFKDSIIKGFNLQKIIDSARLLISGRPLPAENKKDQTVFSMIKGTAVIKNGLIKNDDLLAESSKLRGVGKGTVNLINDALDYNIDARLLKAGNDEKSKFKGVPLIVDVKGVIGEPSYQLDLTTMVKAKYQNKIDKAINKNKDKILEKVNDKLGSEVGDLLKSFF